MSLRIHPLANEEMSEAFSWLIQKGRPEVAGRLFRLWLAGLEAIEEFPMRYPLAEDQPKLWEYRSYLLPSYGYRIIYEVRRDTVFVVSFARGRRRPGHWHDRLDVNPAEPE